MVAGVSSWDRIELFLHSLASVSNQSPTSHGKSPVFIDSSHLSDLAELLSFSPPASESTIEYRTSSLWQARTRPKLKAAPVYLYRQLRVFVFQ